VLLDLNALVYFSSFGGQNPKVRNQVIGGQNPKVIFSSYGEVLGRGTIFKLDSALMIALFIGNRPSYSCYTTWWW